MWPAGRSLRSPFLCANRLLYYWGEIAVFEGRAVLCLNYVEKVGQKSALGETVRPKEHRQVDCPDFPSWWCSWWVQMRPRLTGGG